MTLSADKPALPGRPIPGPHDDRTKYGQINYPPASPTGSYKPDAAEPFTQPAPPVFSVHKVAIVGAGPSGLAAAKYLLAQGEGSVFREIDIFEQRGEVGGVWLHTPWATPAGTGCGNGKEDGMVLDEVPLTDPFVGVDEPVFSSQLGSGSSNSRGGKHNGADGVADGKTGSSMAEGNGASKELGETKAPNPIFPSPMYDELNTNIPHTLMQYSDQPFPEGCEIYPTRQVVQDYLVQYARDVRHLINFGTQVVDVSLITNDDSEHLHTPLSLQGHAVTEKWRVTTRSLMHPDRLATSAVYDAVVIASGHYATPYVPDIPGIREFHATYPDVIAHSKSYRSPYDPGYDCSAPAARKVVVVGNSASGLDIAGQIRKARAATSSSTADADDSENTLNRDVREGDPTPVITSVQSPTTEDMRRFIEEDQGFVYDEASPIARFLVEGKGLEFADGRVEYGVDRVLFATGYLYTFPFLNGLSLSASQKYGEKRHIELGKADVGHKSATLSSDNEQQREQPQQIGSSIHPAPRPATTTAPTRPLITDGRRVHSLAKHFLHTTHPTLVFPGLPIKVIPFPFAEAQAAVFSRLWANVIPLPPQEVLDQWEREPEEAAQRKYVARQAAKAAQDGDGDGDGAERRPALSEAALRAKAERGYHVFDTGADGKYINDMAAWVARYGDDISRRTGTYTANVATTPPVGTDEAMITTGRNSLGKSGSSRPAAKSTGKRPPFWNEELLWQRTIFAQARIAFERDGRKAKTLEQLGFVFPGDGRWQSLT